jgi:hypothetical protein
LAKVGNHADAQAALDQAERSGYAPTGLFALRGYCHVSRREDREARLALDRALEMNPDHRVALVNRAHLGLAVAMGKPSPPAIQAISDVERALTSGPADGNLSLWAAQFYAWMAHKPAHVQGQWYIDQAGAKERCRALLRQAAEYGAPEGMWKQDSTFQSLFGNPAVYSRDWIRPNKEADIANYWRIGNPLVEFAG